jgi:uncharacterized membrane-anchored protein
MCVTLGSSFLTSGHFKSAEWQSEHPMQGLSHKIHPQRFALTNELHARPFSKIDAPSSAACIALTSNGDAKEDKDHLKQLLDRFGASHPSEASDHHSADLGFAKLKWERHSEFVTFTLMTDEASEPVIGWIWRRARSLPRCCFASKGR